MTVKGLVKRRTANTGLPPGTPVHIGEQKSDQVRITLISYDEAHLDEKRLDGLQDCPSPEEPPAVTWINVDGLHEVDVLEKLGECFHLHPLVVEDILNTDQRPKVEDYEEYIFVVLKSLCHRDQEDDELAIEQISLILGPNYVLSFQEQAGDEFDPIRERIRDNKGRARKMGADYLAYALIDLIVDNYFVVLEQFGERIDPMQEELVTTPTTETLQVIHALKRELTSLRKSLWPLREVVGRLERWDSPLIQQSTRIYMRDVYDHIIQVIDAVETFRDILSGMLDIYLSSTSNRMNEIMKVLTIIATLFIPLTFITGVFGMNFEYMPGLKWRWGYPAAWGIMIAIAIVMLVYFRRKKWL